MVCPVCSGPLTPPWQDCTQHHPTETRARWRERAVAMMKVRMHMPFVSKERLYVDPDGTVLREDDLNERSVATLLVAAGVEVSDQDVERYGLRGKRLVRRADEPDDEPEAAAAEPEVAAVAPVDDDTGDTAVKAVKQPEENKAVARRAAKADR